MNKFCSKCNKFKSIEEFRESKLNLDGLFRWCKECEKVYKREYYQRNKEKVNKKNILWKENNRERYDEYHKKYWIKNKERLKKINKENYLKNKNRIAKQKQEYDKHKRQIDPIHKLKQNTRNLIRNSFKKTGYSKTSKTFQILGCTFEDLNRYLFENAKKKYPDFTPKDYLVKGKYHIDHIIPLVTAKTEEDVIKLNHYTNLQLLTAEDNNIKRDFLNWRK